MLSELVATNPLGNGTQVWKTQQSEQADHGEGGDEQFVVVTRLSTSDTTDQSSWFIREGRRMDLFENEKKSSSNNPVMLCWSPENKS